MISIIIPVYNSERYLVRCIESILHQTYSDFELLLINDGSTDNSGSICEKYASLDKRVKSYHTENRGVSAARNIGLEKAVGDYVAFYDSDDFLKDLDSLEQLCKYAEQFDADIVKGNYATFDNTGYWSYPKIKHLQLVNKKLSMFEFINNVLKDEFFLWLLLIKRSVIGNNRFVEGRVYLEDMEFIFKWASNINTAVYLPIRHYVYRKHASAISYQSNPQKISDVLGVMYSFLNYATSNDVTFNDVCIKKAGQLYRSSLDMIALGGFFNKRNEMIDRFDINKHRQVIVKILKTHKIPIKIIYRVAPNHAIISLFINNKLKTMLYRMSYKVKCYLGAYK